MTVRDDIAAALSVTVDVDGRSVQLTGHTVQPDTVGPWDAWASWASTRWLTFWVKEYTYNVIVALPVSDQGSWAPAADEVVEAVGEALYAKGIVPGTATPVQIVMGVSAPMPAVQIQITI